MMVYSYFVFSYKIRITNFPMPLFRNNYSKGCSFIILILLLVYSKTFAQTPLYTATPISDVGVNNSIGEANTSRNIAVSPSGNIYVVYVGSSGVRVATSLNRGQSFNPSVQIDNETITEPEIAVNDNGVVFVLYAKAGTLFLSRSTDDGASFSAPRIIANSFSSQAAHMAFYNSNIYITDTFGTTLFFNANQGIGNFSTSSTLRSFVFADVLTDLNVTVYLPTDDPRLFLFRSVNDGNTLNEIALIPEGRVFFSSYALSDGPCGSFIFVGGGGSADDSKIGYKIDLSSGMTIPIALAENSTIAQGRTLFADNRGTLIDGYRRSSGELMMNVSGDQGQSFDAPITIATGLSHNITRNPEFDDIDVVYSNNGQIFLSVYPDLLKNIRLPQPDPPIEFCTGTNTFELDFDLSGAFDPNTDFDVLLSNELGDFTNAVQIGTTTTNTDGSITCTLPNDLVASDLYRILVKSDANCSQSNTINVSINLATISGSLSLCENQISQLIGSGTAASTGAWVSSNTAVASIDQNGLVSANTSGTTDITYTKQDGCGTTTTLIVSQEAVITGNTILCEGNTSQLTGSGNASTAAPWTSADVNIATVDNTGLITAVNSGSTEVTYLNDVGCSDVVKITVGNGAVITGDALLCISETSQLISTGASISDSWQSFDLSIATVDNNGLVTAVSNGTATINFTNIDNCSGSIQIVVTEAIIINGNMPICLGEQNQLSFSGGSSDLEWISMDNNVATVSTTGLVDAIGAGTVMIQGMDDNACSSFVTIVVNDLPSFFLPADIVVCVDANGAINQEIPIIDSGLSSTVYSFDWFLDGTLLPFESEPFISATVIGEYTLVVTTISTGCQSTDSSVLTPSSPPALEATVTSQDFSDDQTIIATAAGIGEYEFSLNNGFWQDSGTFTNLDNGQYVITVRDKNGCGSSSLIVYVLSFRKFFTPNSDGFNDVWSIKGLKEEQDAKTYIFDRYGKLLKQLSGADSSWDGTFLGEPLPSSDYWFKVDYIPTGSDARALFSSHFTLKR
jgi:gliding motility-associated-like protein